MKKFFVLPLLIFICIAFFLVLLQRSHLENIQIIFSDKAPKPIGPYSQGIMQGNFLFVSGQIGINAVTSKLDSSTIEIETRQTLENVKAVLEEAGCSLKNVVKTTIYLTNLGNFKQVNEVYGNYFTTNPPARETVEVKALPKGAHIEISVMAIK